MPTPGPVDTPPPTITVTDAVVNNLIAAFQIYVPGLNIRRYVEVVSTPWGSYVNDLLIFANNGKTLQEETLLAVVAPGIALNNLSNDGLVIPPFQNVPGTLKIPGVNYFPVTPSVGILPVPTMNFIGPEIVPGSGRHQALPNPLDIFKDGNIVKQNGKNYIKVVVQGPFGPAAEWDEVTVVGPGS